MESTISWQPLKILAAARTLPFHSIGGMQAIGWDVLRGLAGLGHRVTVLTTTIPGRPAAFEEQGVRVEPLAGTPPERYSGAWWRASRRYVSEQPRGAIDAVFSISSAAAGLISLKHTQLSVPFVLQAHGSAWGGFVARWQSPNPLDWLKSGKNLASMAGDATFLRRFDEFVLVGENLAKQFESGPMLWMTAGVRKTVIRNGIDTGLFRIDEAVRSRARAEFGWTPRHRVAIFAARLHSQKGAAEALRAFALLHEQDPDWRFLAIGAGPESENLRRLADELHCATAVVFAGAVSRERMSILLNTGNVFVFPSLAREGLPLNVLEALSVGLPCVCSDSLREVLGARLPASYAPPRNSQALARTIESVVLRAPPQASLLPPDYSLEDCVRSYAALFQRLVRN